MKPPVPLFAVLLFVPLATLCAKPPSGPEPAVKPNIIFILADDLGYGDVGCYGAKVPVTPNVDRLAREGLRFTSGYCTSATCTPSRYSLMTGEYAFRKKGTGVLPGDAALIIEPGRVTLPTLLKRAGYRTAVVGKWHLGLGSPDQPVEWNAEVKPGPLEVGFDHSFIMAATGDRVPCVYVQNHKVVGLVSDDPIRVNYKEAFPGEPDGVADRATLKMDWSHTHNNAVINGIGRLGFMKGGTAALWKDEDMADVFTKEALSFIEREKQGPFFLYFATHDIHVPRVPHPRYAGKSGMGPRGDAILEFDGSVGAILAKLDELKLTENTLVILSSDNGPVLDDGYQDQANEALGDHKPGGPLRGGKYSLYEGGTRVPFITRWPARIKPGTSNAMISQVDLPASLGALCGQGPDRNMMPDSLNLLPALLGESSEGRDHVVEHANRIALRKGDWKFIPPGPLREGLGPHRTSKVEPPGQLFNLSSDPGEETDLAAQHPDKVAEMTAAVAPFLSSIARQKPAGK